MAVLSSEKKYMAHQIEGGLFFHNCIRVYKPFFLERGEKVGEVKRLLPSRFMG